MRVVEKKLLNQVEKWDVLLHRFSIMIKFVCFKNHQNGETLKFNHLFLFAFFMDFGKEQGIVFILKSLLNWKRSRVIMVDESIFKSLSKWINCF